MLTPSLFELKGKIALVTGCNKGIGKAMAIALAEAGADIIGVSGSLASSGSEIELAVTALGRKFFAYQANLSERTALLAFVEKVQSAHPVIDILINNAGTIMRKPAAEHPDEYWDQVLALNLDAPFILAREFGKKMKGYYTNEAVVVATESRTSSPVRIPRDKEKYNHPEVSNLFPCGEGAGYAGGIVSAAMDGENCASALQYKV